MFKMQISIAIPTYNRTELLYESFKEVLDDDRVSEIVIVDDCSLSHVQLDLISTSLQYPKVKLFVNDSNLDCYFNKWKAISRCVNEWVIILDSDNILKKNYIDRVENLWTAGLNPRTIYQPSFAMPHFDFTKYEGLLINKNNVAKYVSEPKFETMLNAFNFFVNKEEYLKVFDMSVDPVTSDSIYFNYKWLEAGNSIYVVSNLSYFHRVHEGSHYQMNVKRTPQNFHRSIVDKLKSMM